MIPDTTIRPAAATDAEGLSAVAMRAKAHWGYSSAALESWRNELTLSEQDVRSRPVFVARTSGGAIAGFYSLRASEGSWELDHLWVVPEQMRKGIGRALLTHALETAARAGATEVTVDADPNAERFYIECGAVRRGMIAAPLPDQPYRARPQLVFAALTSPASRS